jgi:hypothetical protein
VGGATTRTNFQGPTYFPTANGTSDCIRTVLNDPNNDGKNSFCSPMQIIGDLAVEGDLSPTTICFGNPGELEQECYDQDDLQFASQMREANLGSNLYTDNF